MAMPNDLVFVRHGESEANIVQLADKSGQAHARNGEVFDRPDWEQRLSSRGIEQVKLAKIWVDENLGGACSFDRRYFSPFLRTRETAAYLGGEDWEELPKRPKFTGEQLLAQAERAPRLIPDE